MENEGGNAAASADVALQEMYVVIRAAVAALPEKRAAYGVGIR